VDWLVLAIFVLVYAGMMLGEIPGPALDRSGIALLGAIAVPASGRLTLEEAWRAVDVRRAALLGRHGGRRRSRPRRGTRTGRTVLGILNCPDF